MNVNDLFMYIFLFIIFCIVILCVIKFNKNKTKIKKKVNTPKIKESFRSTITMDHVLDKYCIDSSEFPSGNDNYLGPWDNVPEGECSFYECPQEYCYTLTPSFTNDDNNYRYVINQSPQQRSNSSDGSTDCVSKQNNSNIYSCSPSPIQIKDNKPEPCGNQTPYDAWYFDSSELEWKFRNINQFYNSNGDCVTKDVNYPYDEVYYIELDSGKLPGSETSSTKRLGNSNNTVHYNNRGLSCEMKQTKETNNNSNYWVPVEISGYDINDSSYLELVDSEIDEFSSFWGGFRCKNGNVREYSYASNDEGIIDGTKCGFSNKDDNCKSCSTGIKTCYDFVEEKRSWNTTKYVRTNQLEFKGMENDCKIYKVKPDTDIDINQLGRLDYLNSILGHDLTDEQGVQIVGGGNYISISEHDDDFKSNCITTDYTGLCGKEVLCPMLGSKISERIDTHIKLKPDKTDDDKERIFDSIIKQTSTLLVDPLTSDDDKKFIKYNIRLKEVFKSGGSNCEHCFIGNNSECIEDLNYFTMSNEMCDEACPDGTVLNIENLYKPYCQKCTLDEYFDTDKKKCIPFSGCPAGTYFDPSSNIRVKPYSSGTEYSDLYEATPNVTMDDIYFLDDNTDSNCKPCTSNTYMDKFLHTDRSCSTCELIQKQSTDSILKTVNKNRTSCETCIINNGLPNRSEYSKNAKYVTTLDGTYTCKSCPNLDHDDDDKAKSYIIGITPRVLSDEQPGGTCYKKCHDDITINNQKIEKNQRIEMNSDDSGGYSNCKFTCSANYFRPKNSNSCFPCPVGKDRALSSSDDSICASCIDGYYNDVPGGTCQLCPTIDNGIYFKLDPHSTVGRSNIEQCYYKCLSNDGNESIYNAMLYGTKQNHLYDFDSCPTEDCFAGYEKQNLSENTGYKLIVRKGTLNMSKVNEPCRYSGGNITQNNLCDAGFEQNEAASTEIHSKSNVICCRRGLDYKSNTETCECPVAPADSLIESYEWRGSSCFATCAGSAIRQFDNSCLVTCKNGEYVDGSSCSNCPQPNLAIFGSLSNPSYAYNDDGKYIEGCYFRSCPEGYYLPTGDVSRFDSPAGRYTFDCTEITKECNYYSNIPLTTQVIENNKINGFSSDTITPITLQRYFTKELTKDECITKINEDNAINDPYILDYTPGSYKRGYCSNLKNIQRVQYKQIYDGGKFLREEGIGQDKQAIFCCPEGLNGSMGQTIGGSMKYRCCPTGEKIHIDSEQVVTCKNIDCPPPTAIEDYVFYSDKTGIPDNQFLDDHSNCRIECNSAFRWNAEDSNCALYEPCDPIYEKQDLLSSSNKGLSVYKLEEQSPYFDCAAKNGEYYQKLSLHSCIQDVDSVSKDTLQYCCPSGFTYDREKNDCMRTLSVCLGGK